MAKKSILGSLLKPYSNGNKKYKKNLHRNRHSSRYKKRG